MIENGWCFLWLEKFGCDWVMSAYVIEYDEWKLYSVQCLAMYHLRTSIRGWIIIILCHWIKLFSICSRAFMYFFSIKIENPIEYAKATATVAVDAGPGGVIAMPVNTFPCRNFSDNIQQERASERRRKKLALRANEMLLWSLMLLPWLLSSFLLSSPLSLLRFSLFSPSRALFGILSARPYVFLCVGFFLIFWSLCSIIIFGVCECVRTDVLCKSLFSQFQLRARCVCFNMTQTHSRAHTRSILVLYIHHWSASLSLEISHPKLECVVYRRQKSYSYWGQERKKQLKIHCTFFGDGDAAVVVFVCVLLHWMDIGRLLRIPITIRLTFVAKEARGEIENRNITKKHNNWRHQQHCVICACAFVNKIWLSQSYSANNDNPHHAFKNIFKMNTNILFEDKSIFVLAYQLSSISLLFYAHLIKNLTNILRTLQFLYSLFGQHSFSKACSLFIYPKTNK